MSDHQEIGDWARVFFLLRWQSGQMHLSVEQASERTSEVRILPSAQGKEKIMNNENLSRKAQRQLAEREAKQQERSLRRAQEMQQGLVNSEGKIVGSASFAFEQMRIDLLQEPEVANIFWSDIQSPLRHTDNTFHVALEFCPLYTQGTPLSEGKLDTSVMTESDVQSSRVGKKWDATKIAIMALQKVCQQFHTQLMIHATFADIGIMVGKREDADEEVLRQHEDLYRHLMQQLANGQEIPVEFRRLSDMPVISHGRTVGKFVIASEGRILAQRPTEDELLQLLELTPEEIPVHRMERSHVLLEMLDACGGNIDLLRCLVDTYINYPTTSGADIHLAVERSGSLLVLQVMHKDSDAAKIPRLNIIVK